MEEQPDSEPSSSETGMQSASIQKVLNLAGSWGDLDWDDVEQELYRIRHETGKPIPWEFFESLIETLEVLNDAELMESIRRGIQDITEGRLYRWEDVKRELGLE